MSTSTMAFIVLLAGAIIFAIIIFYKDGWFHFLCPAKLKWGEITERKIDDEEFRSICLLSELLYGRPSHGLDEITWNDLSLDEVYMRIAGTYTQPGDAALFHMIRHPVRSLSETKERDDLLKWARNNVHERNKIIKILSGVGRPRYISLKIALEAPFLSRWLGMCLVLSILLLLTIILIKIGWSAAIPLSAILFAANNVISVILHRRFDHVTESIGALLALVRCSRKISDIPHEGSGLLKELASLMPNVRNVRDNGLFSMLYDNNPITMMLNYSFLLTPIAYLFIAKRVRENRDVLLQMIGILGKIDALLAVASYRDSLPFWCEPVWKDEVELSVRGLVHPLLPTGIRNDLHTQNHILITGSNATGKSTFIKAVAVNAILAQSILTCTADSYAAPLFRIQTSMALRDDLLAGESYFIVEIRALKRMHDAVLENDLPCLLAIDEVLRGTNTAERIAASGELLRMFAGMNCLCIAATHDVELTHDLEDCFRNYHFTETLNECGMTFDYRIREGRATSRNAIELLRFMGFEEDLVNRASARVQKWEGHR